MHNVSGTEEGWAGASHDSRRDMKQRDIAATVGAMKEASEKRQREWEDKLGDELVAATEGAVLKGGVNCVGSTRAYRTRYDLWLDSLKENAT